VRGQPGINIAVGGEEKKKESEKNCEIYWGKMEKGHEVARLGALLSSQEKREKRKVKSEAGVSLLQRRRKETNGRVGKQQAASEDGAPA